MVLYTVELFSIGKWSFNTSFSTFGFCIIMNGKRCNIVILNLLISNYEAERGK